MTTRGIRGAINVTENTPEAILQATKVLLKQVLQLNPRLNPADIASVIFTLTPDLNAAFPALGARQIGWVDVPLLCYQEIAVPDGLPQILRVLIHWNTDLAQKDIRHVYLGAAVALRPERTIDLHASTVQ